MSLEQTVHELTGLTKENYDAAVKFIHYLYETQSSAADERELQVSAAPAGTKSPARDYAKDPAFLREIARSAKAAASVRDTADDDDMNEFNSEMMGIFGQIEG